jgi:hypothetical protein
LFVHLAETEPIGARACIVGKADKGAKLIAVQGTFQLVGYGLTNVLFKPGKILFEQGFAFGSGKRRVDVFTPCGIAI